MASLRQILHNREGVPSTGFRFPASSNANVDDEGERLDYPYILCGNFRGKGDNAQSTGFEIERPLHDPQLLPHEHQRDLVGAFC